MAWKQDLAKLKQQLAPEDAVPAPKPKPKPAPKPEGPAVIEDEDAVFLSAMGLKRTPSRPTKAAPSDAPPEPPAAPEPKAPETFQDALKELKGLKPMARGIPGTEIPAELHPRKPQEKQAPEAPVADEPPPAEEPPPAHELSSPQACAPAPLPPEREGVVALPVRFQLAAGMALEVDGTLDLRGHSLPDALERLKDRLGDGMVLGWRSLQVTLGPDPLLHEGLLDLLASGQIPMVARYAQAPVPMGGSQAWLLYFSPPTIQS